VTQSEERTFQGRVHRRKSRLLNNGKILKELWFSEVYRREELLSGLFNTCMWSTRAKSQLVM